MHSHPVANITYPQFLFGLLVTGLVIAFLTVPAQASCDLLTHVTGYAWLGKATALTVFCGGLSGWVALLKHVGKKRALRINQERLRHGRPEITL